ncbi:hypothetical protein NBRC116188_26270 [Oceaniserpentilla sp. 4NH20-0058]
MSYSYDDFLLKSEKAKNTWNLLLNTDEIKPDLSNFDPSLKQEYLGCTDVDEATQNILEKDNGLYANLKFNSDKHALCVVVYSVLKANVTTGGKVQPSGIMGLIDERADESHLASIVSLLTVSSEVGVDVVSMYENAYANFHSAYDQTVERDFNVDLERCDSFRSEQRDMVRMVCSKKGINHSLCKA